VQKGGRCNLATHRSKAGEYHATANILGAAVIGTDRSTGVIDWYGHAFGYENLLVCDGAMPANPGVNPSLTITHDRARDALQPTKAMCRRRACVKFAGMSCAQWGSVGHFDATGAS
jgi:choline dehydrogenase-like flavoprotein